MLMLAILAGIIPDKPIISRFATSLCCGIGAFAFGFIVFKLLGAVLNIWVPTALTLTFLWNDSRRLSARRSQNDGSERSLLAIKLAEVDRFGDAAGVFGSYVVLLNFSQTVQ